MSKELSMEDQVAQQIALMNKEFELKQEQRECNQVKVGARISAKDIKKGSPVIDKVTGEQKILNGVPQNYLDKYFVSIQFMGAELKVEVIEDVFHSLEEMKTYLCEGYLGEVKNFGDSSIQPIFRKFTKI